MMRARPKQDTPVSVRLTTNEDSEEQKPRRPYDLIADLIGSVVDLDPDLSAKTGERFAEIVGGQARKP